MSQTMGIQQLRGLSGVYCVLPLGGQYWNGTAWENYNQTHMNLYKIAMTDPNNIGFYTAVFPNGIVTLGTYPFLVYQQVGGSPDLTADNPLGAGNVEVPQGVGAIPPSLTGLILRLRVIANDEDISNSRTEEGARPPADGAGLRFRLQQRNVTVGSVYASWSTNFRTQNGFVVDYQNGIVSFSSAPTNSLTFDYTFQLFNDSEHQEFLNSAAEALSMSGPTGVPDGLVPSMLQFALYFFYLKRAAYYSDKFNSSGGMATEQIDAVTNNMKDLAKLAYKNAMDLMNNFYKKAGQQQDPAFGINRVGMDPFTPRR